MSRQQAIDVLAGACAVLALVAFFAGLVFGELLTGFAWGGL